MTDVNSCINSAGAVRQLVQKPATLLVTLGAFVDQNEDPSTSSNLECEAADDLQPLIHLLSEPSVEDNGSTRHLPSSLIRTQPGWALTVANLLFCCVETLLLLVLKSLKILSRKFENRVRPACRPSTVALHCG